MKFLERIPIILILIFFIPPLKASQGVPILLIDSATTSFSNGHIQKIKTRKIVKEKNSVPKRKQINSLFYTFWLIIAAVLVPPLAILIYDGEATKRFWLNLSLILLVLFFPLFFKSLLLISTVFFLRRMLYWGTILHAILVVLGLRFH